MLVVHVGSKTWPPRHGGVEKVVYDLATGLPESSVVFAGEVEETKGNVPIHVQAAGLLGAMRQLSAFAASCPEKPLFHFHKETSIPLALLMRLKGQRCVLTLHGFAWRIARWSWLQRSALWLLDLAAYLLLQRIVFVGEHDWRAVRRWLPLSRLRWVPNGVETAESEREQIEEPDSWVYLGRISPEKNLLGLLEEAGRKSIRLHVYGPLDERDPDFAACFRELAGQEGITWHGALPFEQVPPTLDRYGVLVNVSFSEGLPVSVLEGASRGLKLVLSDIGQHKLLGFPCVHYVQAEELCLEGPPEGPGDPNRLHAARRFSKQAMLQGYEAIYRELAEAGPDGKY